MQTRYNLPLEVFYTIAPVLMCVVFFFHTVRVQDELDRASTRPRHDRRGDRASSGRGPSTTASASRTPAPTGERRRLRLRRRTSTSPATAARSRRCVLPVDQTIQFNLHSPDVIHDFGVPAFLIKMDVIPGRVNKLQVTPTVEGDYAGKCYELCGVYHSRMLFNVKVVEPGRVRRPPRGPGRGRPDRRRPAPRRRASSTTQAGLDDESRGGASE